MDLSALRSVQYNVICSLYTIIYQKIGLLVNKYRWSQDPMGPNDEMPPRICHARYYKKYSIAGLIIKLSIFLAYFIDYEVYYWIFVKILYIYIVPSTTGNLVKRKNITNKQCW